MDRLKTFLKYAILLVGFYLLSNFLIFVGLNSSYNDIHAKSYGVNQVDVQLAEATLVNGRVKGIIQNSPENNLNGKYIRFDFYSARDVLLGTKYIPVQSLGENDQEEFRVFFKLQDVEYYDVSITDEMEKVDSEPFLDADMETQTIIFATIFTMLMLM